MEQQIGQNACPAGLSAIEAEFCGRSWNNEWWPATHPNPQQFAGFVFASLRGMGMFDLFEVAQEEIDGQLEILVQIIVQAGLKKK